MTEITSEQAFKDLEDLKDIAELDSLYLTEYFNGLRNEVDKEITSQLVNLKNDEQKKTELNKIWHDMIARINAFEQECIYTELNLAENKERIQSIEETLYLIDKELVGLEKIFETIESEEINLTKQLFQNKSIIFLNTKEFCDDSERNIKDSSLIILNDEAITKNAFKKK